MIKEFWELKPKILLNYIVFDLETGTFWVLGQFFFSFTIGNDWSDDLDKGWQPF